MRKYLLIVACAFAAAVSLPAQSPSFDRSQLPAALQEADLRHLSSGALLLLNRNNNLVAPPRQWNVQGKDQQAAAAANSVALDPRIGANIRLGNDPAALPANMRAQAEPHIFRSPTTPDLLVATFQEGRFTDGGAVDCGYSVTHDGGLTWSRALIPNLTQVVGGPYFRATDPVAAIDRNNNIFLNTDDATDSTFATGIITVSKSTDSGQTFRNPVVVYNPNGANIFPDKNWMAVNNFAGTASVNRVVVTFTEFFGDVSPIVRSYSDDGGATWSALNYIHASNTKAQGSQPVFLPGNKLAIVYWNFGNSASPGEHLEVVVSTTGGVSFGAPVKIANVVEYNEPNIRSGGFLPSATTAGTTGKLFVVYQTVLNGSPRIAFTRSLDSGATWSVPIAISDNPSSSGVFNPAISASPDGQTLTAAFYDHRANPGSTTLVDMYLAQSFDGGTTWQPNIRLTSVSSDASLAPLTASGYMLGDYLGIAESTNAHVPAIPVWVDTRTGNPDPFITRAGIAPAFTFDAWQAARLSLAQINAPQYGLRQLNISTRAPVGSGASALIGGFIVTGNDPKNILIRGLGPSLTAAGVLDALQDPTLELHNNSGAIIYSNDNWKDTQQSAIQATGVPPTDDREAAIVQTVAPGSYTAVLRGKNDSTGTGLVEVYDLNTTANSQLANISTRGQVLTGNGVMIGGFIVGGGNGPNGTGSAKVLLRALGPSLSASVAGALQDPVLELHDADGTAIFTNDNWKDAQQSAIQATGVPPTDDRESAIVVLVPPGNYTAVVRGKNNTTGIALVEAYNVP